MTPEQKTALAEGRERAKHRPKRSAHNHLIRCADGNYFDCRLTRKLAIKAFCTECMGWEDDPKRCGCKFCPLYPFRGKTLYTQAGHLDSRGREICVKSGKSG